MYAPNAQHLTSEQSKGKIKAFTLVEMSMVVLIAGIILMTILPTLTAMREAEQQRLSRENLQSVLRAIAIYIQGNGCLPCPTPANISGAGFGVVRGATGTTIPPCGACTTTQGVGLPQGIVPFASLGIPARLARDGWGRWITMRVDPALTVNFAILPPTAVCLSSDPAPCVTGTSRKGLCRPDLNETGRILVTTPAGSTQQAAIMLVSHGKNGFGAYNANPISTTLNGSQLPFPASQVTCANNGFERCNAAQNAQFWDSTQVIGGTAEYDDILTYLDRKNLVALYGNGSTCSTSY